ncbi:hypothetical protein COT48_02810 [Candidatus Woesearchaeota archaeon CG08_land_8_20_14_0_20_47_9]|nr:MAG: hypothetical protein COT48_02810 [Candidatus Woesearchaeota archaeon CG08_land_8_20_14_0_20_47_9]
MLEVKQGFFTGRVLEFHNDKSREAMRILREAKIKPEEAISIGDGRDDAEVFKKVRFGVAYNGCEAARKAAKYSITGFRELLGIVERDG